MAPVLWVLAVLSTITVIHRIQYTYQNTKTPGAVQPVELYQQVTILR